MSALGHKRTFAPQKVMEERGVTPVLTANKSFILGYTNEKFGIYESLPVIIFDDFTTDSKYVDFPFKVKSSAIKILSSRSPEVNLRFVAERMRLVRFPVGEHKRYYISEYQHIELPTPDPEEQRAIAAALSDMDAELSALEACCDKTRDLKQAMMQELLTGKTRLTPAGVAHA
jgi:type I restriction enzyme, S subunit